MLDEAWWAIYHTPYQGCLFFYYSPQTLGNNFFTLGKNSKFWGKKKINNNEKQKQKNKNRPKYAKNYL